MTSGKRKPMTLSSFALSEDHKALLKSIARYNDTTMSELLRDWIMAAGKEIVGPLTITTVEHDEDGKEITQTMPFPAQAIGLSLIIEEKLEQDRVRNEEAIEDARLRLERAKEARRDRREVAAAEAE